MSIRQDKIQSTIQKELVDIIRREVNDPRIGLVSINEVHVSADLQHATVFVGMIGDEGEKQQTLKALEAASGFIHNLLGRRIHIKRIPALIFKLDTSVERSARIMELLKEVNNETSEEDA